MGPVALQFLADIVALFEPGRCEGAVGRGHIVADDCAAAAADLAAQVFQLEPAAGNSSSGHTVLLVDYQSGQRCIFKQECMTLASGDKRFLSVAVLDGKSSGRGQLLYSEPAVPQTIGRAGQLNAAIFVRCEYAQVVEFAGFRIIAGVPHLKTNIGEAVMGDAVLLDDLNDRPLVVVKICFPVPVGVQGDILVRGVHQIGVISHRSLGNLENPWPEVRDSHRPVRPGGHFGNAVTVRRLHQKGGVGNGDGVIVGVKFPDGKVGPLIILQADSGVLSGEQLHMVLGGVQQVIRHRGGFFQGINARFQALPADLTCAGRGAVQIPGAVLDFGETIGDAAQGLTIRTLLIQMETGQLAIGEHELRLFAAIQMDDALGVVDHIARTIQFSHDIGGIGGELGEVDGPILRGSVFLRPPGTVHRLKAELRVGDGLGEVGAVHLD